MMMHIEFHLEDGRTHMAPWSSGAAEAIRHAASAIRDGQAVSAIVRDEADEAIWDSTGDSVQDAGQPRSRD